MNEEHAAYVRAYELFDEVQTERHLQAAADLPTALATAVERGWGRVAFVLSAVRVVHGLTRATHEPVGDLIADLVRQADELDAPALSAMAYGLRAFSASASGDASALLADASKAVALLDDPELPAVDRCMAYVVVAASYNTLRLWELVDDLYSQAVEIGPLSEAPSLAGTVAVNRVLTRLEWALALIETGDDDGAARQLHRVREAVADAGAHVLTPLWARNVEAGEVVSRLLLEAEPAALADEVQRLRRELADADDLETLPLLNGAWALALWRSGDQVQAQQVARPLVRMCSASSGARTFPLWVRAKVLAAAQPSDAVDAHQQHAELVSRLLWQSRHAVLASATAQITVERRQADHDRLFRDVHTDSLTGLLNRRSFDAWLHRRDTSEHPASTLVLVDLDDFKQVNDSYGHGVGDEVLRSVGQLMRSRVRFGDLAIRHGGDEFAILMGDRTLTPNAALERARELREAIADTDWSRVAPGLRVSVSIGVAAEVETAGRACRDAESIYRSADAALYAAKRSGAGIVLAEDV